MSLPISRTSRAIADLVELATYLEEERPGSAEQFLDAADAALSQLSEHPAMGAELDLHQTSAAGIRRWSVPGFRSILILYRVEADFVHVIRVVHGARDLLATLEE